MVLARVVVFSLSVMMTEGDVTKANVLCQSCRGFTLFIETSLLFLNISSSPLKFPLCPRQLCSSSWRQGIGVIGELVTELFVSPISAIPQGADLSCPIPRYFSLSSSSGGPSSLQSSPCSLSGEPAGHPVGGFVAWFTSFTDNCHLQSCSAAATCHERLQKKRWLSFQQQSLSLTQPAHWCWWNKDV